MLQKRIELYYKELQENIYKIDQKNYLQFVNI